MHTNAPKKECRYWKPKSDEYKNGSLKVFSRKEYFVEYTLRKFLKFRH